MKSPSNKQRPTDINAHFSDFSALSLALGIGTQIKIDPKLRGCVIRLSPEFRHAGAKPNGA